MSKVVHLSDDAHTRAKQHCQNAGLRMSDWVGQLIACATNAAQELDKEAQPPQGGTGGGPRQRRQGGNQDKDAAAGPHEAAAASAASGGEDGVPLYAAPPFWAGRGDEKPSVGLME